MSPSGGSRRLTGLTLESERALLAFGQRLGVAPSAASDASQFAGGVSPTRQAPHPLALRPGREVVSDAVNVNVHLLGGTVILDDERRVRALAKEIKRLISEDKRRGLAI